jgi:hypothetical protein
MRTAMARATRIYIAIDYTGEPVIACTVKYEMFQAILRAENLGHNTKSYTYWSVPDNEGTEIKQVTRSFFESK